MNFLHKKVHNFISRFWGGRLFIPKETWNQQFEKGQWDWLENDDEKVRYTVLVNKIKEVKPDSILDLGCGKGVLLKALLPMNFKQYKGIDISSNAIEHNKSVYKEYKNIFWESQSAEEFEDWNDFDLIVFNESINYMDHPERLIRKIYNENKDVKIIISMYQCYRNLKIKRKLKNLIPQFKTEPIYLKNKVKWWIMSI